MGAEGNSAPIPYPLTCCLYDLELVYSAPSFGEVTASEKTKRPRRRYEIKFEIVLKSYIK